MLDLLLLRSERDAHVVKSQLSMISTFLSVLSQNRESISCGAVEVDVMKSPVRVPRRKIGAHDPLDVKSLNVEKLLRTPSYNVMGQIDYFGILKSLLPRPIDNFDSQSMRITQNL